MKPPLEYGDNFPVPGGGGWNPAEPWRFPKQEVILTRQGSFNLALPWITLGLGLSLGILWMSWRTELVQPRSAFPGTVPAQEEGLRSPVRSGPAIPAAPRPARPRVSSRVA